MRKTYSFHPRQLGLEFCLTIDVDDLEFLYEDRETKGRDASETRDPTDIHGNMRYRLEVLCYCFSDAVVP